MKNIFTAALLLICFISFSQKEQSSILVGQKAPMFKAMDQYGKTIASDEILENEQLIVVFYRGQWCPLCNKHLFHLQNHIRD
ncbi:MAG: redoxin domain-containing protein [Marinifilaceae bacterium]|nr:redoxin domain-containing protein [Marinifilaceae bacterium]